MALPEKTYTFRVLLALQELLDQQVQLARPAPQVRPVLQDQLVRRAPLLHKFWFGCRVKMALPVTITIYPVQPALLVQLVQQDRLVQQAQPAQLVLLASPVQLAQCLFKT